MNIPLLKYGCLLYLLGTGLGCQLPYPKRSAHRPPPHASQAAALVWLKRKAHLHYRDAHNRKQQAIVQVRMHRDQHIWCYVTTPLGIAVVRAMATPTQVTIINYLQRAYYVYDYAALSQALGFSCSYSLLQALLLGTWPWDSSSQAHVQTTPQHATYHHHHHDEWYTGTVDRQANRLVQLAIDHMAHGRQGTITYEYSSTHSGDALPCKVTICVPQGAQWPSVQGTVQLIYARGSSWTAQPLTFPFAVPKAYAAR